ncbi:N-acetylmuramoyl-L-alanine amidase family protein [Sporosarcina limicola]|uniref:N-acetylmuramoyl-L-alanine amidase n=1 Tax=Sporosarcina limicola TaxID=34101 RepID=A0A927R3B4_9BACL|nr:N-acetylmuramoyl-L-alanine amidase [Sporosarcina limicola]MBE1554896.1 N-acetylmuramoyl-L-alanine amidase [Sporosarcina limicola]
MTIIMIDAGHGPNTPGKQSPDGVLREFNFNNSVAEMIKRLLFENEMTVIFAHELGRDVPLVERNALANKMNVDAFISIHANAYGPDWNGVSGIETFLYPTASKESAALASLLQSSLIAACNRTDRGVKKADFAVLRDTKMPAVLIECGFMTNREEATLLLKKDYRLQCAKAIAFAISAWLYRGKK